MTTDEYEARIAKLNRIATDRNALVNMLGPNALKVWNGWRANGVQRVHYDWGPEAANMTGEERANHILCIDAEIAKEVAALSEAERLVNEEGR